MKIEKRLAELEAAIPPAPAIEDTGLDAGTLAKIDAMLCDWPADLIEASATIHGARLRQSIITRLNFHRLYGRPLRFPAAIARAYLLPIPAGYGFAELDCRGCGLWLPAHRRDVRGEDIFAGVSYGPRFLVDACPLCETAVSRFPDM